MNYQSKNIDLNKVVNISMFDNVNEKFCFEIFEQILKQIMIDSTNSDRFEDILFVKNNLSFNTVV